MLGLLFCLWSAAVSNNFLDACCKTCKSLYLAWDNDLCSSAVGCFAECLEALELDDLLIRISFVQLNDAVSNSLLYHIDSLSFTLCLADLLLSYSVCLKDK